jgi:hypothetical protein
MGTTTSHESNTNTMVSADEKCTPPSVMDWTDDGAAEEPAMDLEEGTGPDRTAVAAYSGPLASQGVPTPA